MGEFLLDDSIVMSTDLHSDSEVLEVEHQHPHSERKVACQMTSFHLNVCW